MRKEEDEAKVLVLEDATSRKPPFILSCGLI
jgi:hypothetical protein